MEESRKDSCVISGVLKSLRWLLILITMPLLAPESKTMTIITGEPVRPYEAIWRATCKVESDNNPLAIGDKHLKGKSYGIVQVRKTRLSDYHRKTGVMYSERDMFDPAKAKEVFMWYCTGSDMEIIARTWNGGEKGMQKKSTLKYWIKIKSELNGN